MTPKNFFNQTITLYSKGSYNKYGREVVGAGASYHARVQLTNKSKLLPNGQVVLLEAIAYVAGDVSVAINDKITFSGQNYKVWGKYAAVDGQGNTNHLKLELTKWQAT